MSAADVQMYENMLKCKEVFFKWQSMWDMISKLPLHSICNAWHLVWVGTNFLVQGTIWHMRHPCETKLLNLMWSDPTWKCVPVLVFQLVCLDFCKDSELIIYLINFHLYKLPIYLSLPNICGSLRGHVNMTKIPLHQVLLMPGHLWSIHFIEMYRKNMWCYPRFFFAGVSYIASHYVNPLLTWPLNCLPPTCPDRQSCLCESSTSYLASCIISCLQSFLEMIPLGHGSSSHEMGEYYYS